MTVRVVTIALAFTVVALCGTVAHASALPRRIVVVGDLHGDIIQGLSILKHAGIISFQPDYYQTQLQEAAMKWIVKGGNAPLIDREKINRNMVYNKRGEYMAGSRADAFHWAGRNSTLVLVGDALNVGPDDFDIAYFVMRLTEEAREVGGCVVYLLGNHELQNLQGNFMGVHPWSFERSGGREGRAVLLSMRTELGRFMRSRPVLYRAGSLLFMHGGMTSKTVGELRARLGTLDNTTFVDEVNRRVRRALEEMEGDVDGVPKVPYRDPVAKFLLDYDYSSATGDRSPILVHPLQQCAEVERANAALHIGCQVVGHTPHDPPQYSFCNGSLLAVDFHISEWKAGNGTAYAALELRRGPKGLQEQLADPSTSDWSATLIIPRPDELEPRQSRGVAQVVMQAGSTNFIGLLLLCLAAVEAVLYYWRRRQRGGG